MAFNSSLNDDFKTDIKMDNSAPPLTQNVSDISWINNQVAPIFASTCWDGTLRLFQVVPGQYGATIISKMALKVSTTPLTVCCWNNDNNAVFVGCGDGSVKAVDVNSGNIIDIGKQSAGISSLHAIPNQNIVIASGYENNINFWQLGNNSPVFNVDAGNKVFCSDFQFPLYVGGLNNEKVIIFDINNMGQKSIFDSVDLGKNSPLQSIALNHKNNYLGLGTVDGRANISTLTKNNNGSYSTKSEITFKSNKQQQNGNTVLYPVNSVGFNLNSQKWFMTAGSDGVLTLWDFEAKNKIKSLNYAMTPICKAKVSPKGDMIAYALGNDWHIGYEGSSIPGWQPKIGVHIITQQETKFNFKKS